MANSVMFVSPIPLFPVQGGNRARMFTMIRALQQDGYRIGFILLWSRQLEHHDLEAHRREFGDQFFFLTRTKVGNLLYLLRRTMLVKLRRFRRAVGQKVNHLGSVDETFYAPYLRPLRRIFGAEKPAALFVQYAAFSKAFDASPAGTLRVLDTHDSFAHFYAPDEERKAFQRADAVLAIQDEEGEIFRALLGDDAERVHVVSHLLPENVQPVSLRRTDGATFLGSSFTANIASLRWFIDAVLPLIRDKRPDFILTVAGTICKDIPDMAGVRKLGRVDEIRDAFAQGPILINPITAGTGVKIKLLDAMSLGIPAVSTEFGLRGIERDLLTGVLAVDDGDAAGFCDAVIRLMVDENLREAMGAKMLESAATWQRRQLAALRDVMRLVQR